ncbi:MAG: orotidine 5'-phosphate decarboxylase [Nanoarchaeota archaeon]|nr:orotidine 5'-phosphate decarboxylase [Nanoarchaeota archaeon]
MKPKLQVALDVLTIEKALKIAKQIEKYADILELGTPLLKEQSADKAIHEFKKSFPKKIILADMKTMDVGKIEAEIAFNAGADMMTVCGAASNETIKDAIKVARRKKKKVVVDLIGIRNKLSRAKEIEKLKPDYICVHTGIDENKPPFADLQAIRGEIRTPISIAGGLTAKNMPYISNFNPAIVIVGRDITQSKNPRDIAKKIKLSLKEKPKGKKIDIKEIEKKIENEIKRALKNVSTKQTENLISKILESERIFVTGQGRSGLMARAFGMRLMHLGFTTYIIGEAITPALEKGDLMIAITGTGGTEITLSRIKEARKKKAVIAVLTTDRKSRAARNSSLIIEIPAKIDSLSEPLGSLFEQTVLIYLDSIIVKIMGLLGKKSRELKKRHANV